MKRTRWGWKCARCPQNRHMARAMGISDRKVDMLTFGLGSGIAGVAGVALSQLTNVRPGIWGSNILSILLWWWWLAVWAICGARWCRA